MQSNDAIAQGPAVSRAFTDAPPPPAVDANGYRTSPDQDNPGWPPGVPYIVGNEACERFSYYGMNAILYIHLAYTVDLQTFFGRHGWYSAAYIERERHEYPWQVLPFWSWDPHGVVPAKV
ncbi:MAG: hypothetical protein K2W96_04670, partial [Gemmataceae bacterium]|nr:hypothetical protein [Gemmataceae bacterium]